MINRFIFGHDVVIYFLIKLLLEKSSKNLSCFVSQRKTEIYSATVGLPKAPSEWCQMMSHNIFFTDVISTLYCVALNKNRNAVFTWSVDVYFIFSEAISVTLM